MWVKRPCGIRLQRLGLRLREHHTTEPSQCLFALWSLCSCLCANAMALCVYARRYSWTKKQTWCRICCFVSERAMQEGRKFLFVQNEWVIKSVTSTSHNIEKVRCESSCFYAYLEFLHILHHWWWTRGFEWSGATWWSHVEYWDQAQRMALLPFFVHVM